MTTPEDALQLATEHADWITQTVARKMRCRLEHLSEFRQDVLNRTLLMLASLDENKTPTVNLWPSERPTAPAPPLPHGVKGHKR